MKLTLQLDLQLKKTVEELFFLSAQAPALGIDSQKLTVDGHAIFRIAKEYALTQPFVESHSVDGEDLVRMLRFTIWVLGYGGEISGTVSSERNRGLRELFIAVMLQAQAQDPAFESLLTAYGLDRQLDPQGSVARRTSTQRSVALTRTDRTHEVQITVDQQGTKLAAVTTESKWTADGWKSQSH